MGSKTLSRAALATVLLLLIFSVNAVAQTSQAAPARDDWSRLRFLVGNWKGAGTGKPGEGISACSFAFDLGDHVLVRRNRVEFPPKAGEKSGPVHEDLMVIYRVAEGTSLRAIYWDNEGHSIRYALSFPADKSVVFESDPAEPGPRFKLTYGVGPEGVVAVEFAMAPPGASYQTYTRGTMIKVP